MRFAQKLKLKFEAAGGSSLLAWFNLAVILPAASDFGTLHKIARKWLID